MPGECHQAMASGNLPLILIYGIHTVDLNAHKAFIPLILIHAAKFVLALHASPIHNVLVIVKSTENYDL